MDTFYLAIQIAQLLWLIGLTVATWLRKPGLDAGAAVDRIKEDFLTMHETHRAAVERQLRDGEKRMTEIETHMEHMPTKDEVAHLEGTVRTIDTRTMGMAEGLNGLRTSVTRIEDYLLRPKR